MARSRSLPGSVRLLDGGRGEFVGVVNALASVLREDASRAVLQMLGPNGGEGVSTIAVSVARAVESSLAESTCVLCVNGAHASSGQAVGTSPMIYHLTEEDRRAVLLGDLGRIVQRFANNCRIFILDSPPLLSAPISAFAASQVNGSILVIEAERTTISEVQRCQAELERAGGRLLGVLVNKRRRHVPRPIAWLLGLPRAPQAPSAPGN